MCAVVCVNGNWCEKVGELRLALPGVELRKDARYEMTPADGDCLCGIDIRATLISAGVQFVLDDFGDWYVTTEPEPCKSQKA